MKTKIGMNRYLVRIYWSDEDEAYVAEAPALLGCVAHGATMEQAAKAMNTAMRLWLDSAGRHRDPIPEPDLCPRRIGTIRSYFEHVKAGPSRRNQSTHPRKQDAPQKPLHQG
jgi:predicted RNase H-like HicB family nuclease